MQQWAAELEELLARPDVALVAFDHLGFRVPWPTSLPPAGDRGVPLPPTRATLVDVLVPQDAMPVTAAWERLTVEGRSALRVRLRASPADELELRFYDARPEAGVVVGVLLAAEAPTAGDPDSPERPSQAALGVSQRPRSAVVVKTVNSEVLSADERMTLMTGWSEEELRGMRSTELVHPEDVERAVRAWLEMRSSRRPGRARVRHRCSDGSWLWVELENRLEPHPDGHEVVVCEVIDVNDEMASHSVARSSARLFRLLAASLPVGVVLVDGQGASTFASAKALELLGLEQALPGVEEVAGCFVEAGRVAFADAVRGVLADGGPEAGAVQEVVLEAELTGSSGTVRWCRVEVARVEDEGVPGALVCLTDTTERHEREAELQRRAHTDALTGCANRLGVHDRLRGSLSPADPLDRRTCGLVFVDLDGFKAVNDQLGHAAGDHLLREVAHRLRRATRPGDLVGRLGGDEFVVVVPDVDDDHLDHLRQRLVALLHDVVETPQGPARLAASVGAVLSVQGEDLEALVARADTQMYEHKRSRVRPAR